METVIIVIHLMVIVALIAVVLLQRSEGGALGIGGSNAFLSSRGQGNVLTRATAILAAAFFATSLILTVLSRLAAPPSAILNNIPATATQPAAPTGAGTPAGTPAPSTGAPATGGVLNQLNQYLNKSAPAPLAAPTPENGVAVPTAPDTSAAPSAAAPATSAAPDTAAPATGAPQVPNSQ
jgi:preprotein translocase subunit SecG